MKKSKRAKQCKSILQESTEAGANASSKADIMALTGVLTTSDRLRLVLYRIEYPILPNSSRQTSIAHANAQYQEMAERTVEAIQREEREKAEADLAAFLAGGGKRSRYPAASYRIECVATEGMDSLLSLRFRQTVKRRGEGEIVTTASQAWDLAEGAILPFSALWKRTQEKGKAPSDVIVSFVEGKHLFCLTQENTWTQYPLKAQAEASKFG